MYGSADKLDKRFTIFQLLVVPLYYIIIAVTYVHEYHASYKADALAVSRLTVCHSVGVEHPPQGSLTTLLLRTGKVRMGGKSTTCT